MRIRCPFRRKTKPTPPPTPTPPPPPTPTLALSRFREALEWLWPIEGGWYDGSDPRDTNPTNFGITQGTYSRWLNLHDRPLHSVRQITKAEAEEVYRELFWDEAGCEDLTWPLALVHFDAAVNHGTGNARWMLRNSEGDWRRYIAIRRRFYADIIAHNPAMKANERGWTNRMDKLERTCEGVTS